MPCATQIFKKYPNPIFIETGSLTGDGIQQALDAGFEVVYSIELNPNRYAHCMNRFKNNRKVRLIYGNSKDVLYKLLPTINEQITFWIDAHDIDKYPIIREIECISRHHINTHTILIDDLRMFDIKRHGIDLSLLKFKLREINKDYIFCFENGFVINDILVAKI